MKDLSSQGAIHNLSMAGQVKSQSGKDGVHTVILGLGNELLGDEGIGVHAVRQLKEVVLPQTAKIIEVGTAILDALDELKNAERVIVLDAMKDGGTPGTVYKIPLDHCNGSPCIASMHGFDIFRVMAIAGRSEPLPIMVFGVEPKEIGWSMTLSPAVTKSLPYLIDAVQEELKNEKG
ncbi:MAG: hydrogenase maturation protease [Desulforhopalus sp.]